MAIARVGSSGQPIPTGNLSDILEGGRYLGPSRLAAPAIGSGSALGIKALWNKITGGEDEDEVVDVDIDGWLKDRGFNPDNYTDEDKRQMKEDILSLDKERKNIKEMTKKLKEDAKKFGVSVEDESVVEEERETLKELLKKVREDPRNEKSFSEDMIDDAVDAIIKSSLKKIEEGLSKKQAIGESWKEVYETLTSGGLTKQARGGLVGINELTRGLRWQ